MVAHRLRTAGRHARVTQLGGRLVGFVAAMTDTSRVATKFSAAVDALRRSWDASATERRTSRGITDSNRLLTGSVLVTRTLHLASPVVDTARRAVTHASITGFANWTERASRSSWLYRWLTAEPEPDVIVIDLRETFSVGPVIAILDTAVRTLVPASHRSTIVDLAEAIHEATIRAPVRVSSVALLVVVLMNLVSTVAVGEPSQAGGSARVVLLGIAALGTRVRLTWSELVESRPAQLLIAALEPPEPPESWDERE